MLLLTVADNLHDRGIMVVSFPGSSVCYFRRVFALMRRSVVLLSCPCIANEPTRVDDQWKNCLLPFS